MILVQLPNYDQLILGFACIESHILRHETTTVHEINGPFCTIRSHDYMTRIEIQTMIKNAVFFLSNVQKCHILIRNVTSL